MKLSCCTPCCVVASHALHLKSLQGTSIEMLELEGTNTQGAQEGKLHLSSSQPCWCVPRAAPGCIEFEMDLCIPKAYCRTGCLERVCVVSGQEALAAGVPPGRSRHSRGMAAWIGVPP